MANSDHLSQHLLRTMLLEGENHSQIINSVKKFAKGEKTEEEHFALVDTIRKDITRTTRELLTDKQIENFVAEVADQLTQ